MCALRCRGFLFPDAPALASWDAAGEFELVHFASGQRITASGVFGEEAQRFFADGRRGPVLQALFAEHPVASLLDAVTAEPRLALSAQEALHLGGFRTLFLELTGSCNQRCVHCYAEAGPEVRSALDRQTCEAVIAEVPAMGFERVQLTGGEPLLCAFLPELVAELAALRGPTCEIYTNGLLLDDACLDAIAVYSPQLAFSFYSCHPEVHDAITATPESHRRTSEAIRRALTRGLVVRVAVITTAQNADHVDETILYVESLGVDRVSAGRSYAVGRGTLHAGAAPLPSKAPDAAQARPLPARHQRRGNLCVAHDGAVYPCIFSRSAILGRVPERRLSEIAADPWPVAAASESSAACLKRLQQQLPCVECQLTAYALTRLSRAE